ncbi:rod shape-determining protein RodA [Sphingomonas koreensis]|nr:rod shape-determining protein RodA [Sphingomonas koreensis]
MTRPDFIPAPLAQLPWRMLLTVMAIGGFGLVVLYSAAGGSLHPWAESQGIKFAVFLVGSILLSYVPEGAWRKGALPAYAVLLVMLVLVELIGAVRGGGQRWLGIGPFQLQPSEFMKPVIVLAVAMFYDMLPPTETRRVTGVLAPAAMILIPAALIMKQPDLGTALMVTGGGVVVMFLAGVPLRLFVAGAMGVAVAVPLAISFVLRGYQRDRIMIFLDPDRDPLGMGYHISQSKIAIGSGGVLGKGFLQGTQSHLDYLPEGHTDFVFATMAEEWGLVGGVLLIIAFFSVIAWGIGVALHAQTRFARLTAAGLASTIFIYVAINLGMVMGLAPVVGIPLPLVSFGGSAQMTVLICLGILMSIDRQNRKVSRF